jgi:glutathione S-transferase
MDSSVYVRIARLAALEKGVALARQHLDPFLAGGPPDWFLALNPAGKIPVLRHGDFVLTETQAIAAYLDEAFPGPALQPADPAARGRLRQIQGIVDAHAYRPMVWGLYVALSEGDAKPEEIARATADARRALGLLARLAAQPWLLGEAVTLADCHLAPVIQYLTAVPQGRALLDEVPLLAAWFRRCRARAGWAAVLDAVGPEAERRRAR